MKNFGAVAFGFILFIFSSQLNAQLLSVNVPFPTDASSIEIIADATKGNRGLLNHSDTNVYVHTGVITNLSTNSSDWKYVKFNQNFTVTNPALKATSLGNNKWKFVITNIRSYFEVPPGETIIKVNILFRSGDGSKKLANIDGSDMYIQVYQPGAFAAKFTTPAMQPMFNPIPEPIAANVTSVPFTAVSNRSANLTVRFNGTSVATASSNTTVSGTASVTTTCEQNLTLEAVETSTARDTIAWFRPQATYPTGARPTGLREGITYQNNNTEAVFILNAPGKNRVSIIGDFNNWQQTCAGQMTKDGNFFWARITGITPGQYYRYQYIVDDTIRIADPYTELVLDPFNDKFIPATTFPNMPAYPEGRTTGGIVGVIRSGETFNWTDQSYQRPNKYNLNVYELLIRDFSAAQTYQQLKDTLNYLERLGVNCIELMPVGEFDGNNSWGYNPAYHFALDKAYGTKQAFKEFINEAHRRGIAVVIDVVLNQATGQSPLATMWWNKATNKPANDNPYFYVDAQHPFNVYNDFNHNAPVTKNFTERFIEYWLTEYKLDGFRWDLSKGFTNLNCAGNQGCWDAYNQDRINIWENYNNKMQGVSPGSYCILEHLGDNSEEYQLAARGMLLWGKMTENFTENTLGFQNAKSDVKNTYWMYRGAWTNNGEPGRVNFIRDKPGLISYAESHDEERVMFNTRNNNVNSFSLPTALARTEAMTAILFSIPGPKMIWQFGEVGYDFSINYCEDGTINTSCRTAPKPVRWDYWTSPSPNWRRRLYDINAAMMKLRLQRPNAFNSNTIVDNQSELGQNLVKKVVINHASLKMVTVANFNTGPAIATVTFPTSGTYYDYTRGGTFNAFGSPQNIELGAGEYRVLIDQNITGGLVTDVQESFAGNQRFSFNVFPNPLQNGSTVRYELANSSNVSIRLLNIQGQQLYSQNLGFQLKGAQVTNIETLGINTNELPAGTYFLQLNAGKQQLTQKVVVQ